MGNSAELGKTRVVLGYLCTAPKLLLLMGLVCLLSQGRFE